MIDAGGARALWCGVAIAAVLGTAGRARADGTTNEAAAQALFDDAKTLMKNGDYASACPKLDESQRLQPAGGTLMFIGLCREGEGKTATAWAKFNEALSAARRDSRPDRERVAHEHIEALSPKLTRLSIALSDAAKGIQGLEIRRDGEIVPADILGTPIPVDPGSHAIRATAPGMKAWETSAKTAGDGATATVTVPLLERDPDAAVVPPPVPVPVPPPMGAPFPVAPATDTPPAGRTQRTVAVVVGGAGVVLLGVGTYFGVTALSKKGDESAQCPGGSSSPCNSTGVSLSHDAVNDGNVSSVLLGVGAAAVITAGVLWFTAPKSSPTTSAWRVSPLVARDSGGILIGGDW